MPTEVILRETAAKMATNVTTEHLVNNTTEHQQFADWTRERAAEDHRWSNPVVRRPVAWPRLWKDRVKDSTRKHIYAAERHSVSDIITTSDERRRVQAAHFLRVFHITSGEQEASRRGGCGSTAAHWLDQARLFPHFDTHNTPH